MEIKTFGQLKTLMEHELETKPERRIAALKTLFSYQTESEQRTETTHVFNGEGFNKADAPKMSSLLDYYNRATEDCHHAHTPHILEEALSFHEKFLKNGAMK